MNYYIEDLNTEIDKELKVTKDGLIGGTTTVMLHFGPKRIDITNELIWNKNSSNVIEEEELTLLEIYEQTSDRFCDYVGGDYCPIIDVFVEDYKEGYIFQCNNYEQGSWYLHGILGGFA